MFGTGSQSKASVIRGISKATRLLLSAVDDLTISILTNLVLLILLGRFVRYAGAELAAINRFDGFLELSCCGGLGKLGAL